MASAEIKTLLKRLEIPADISRVERISEAPTILELKQWKEGIVATLEEVLVYLHSKPKILTLEEQGNLIFCAVPFIPASQWQSGAEDDQTLDDDEWATTDTHRVAEKFLAFPMFYKPSRELITRVLTENIRPIFKSSPHPHLHSETGRKLSKAAGGSMAMQDYYEGQLWKTFPGIAKVVLWCVHAIEADAYETMWHLLIPPVMTFLDDYEARYKLQGVTIVRELLRRVPTDLLKRTGIDGLLRTSLRTSLSHLQSRETPNLLKAAINASTDLTLLTTSIYPGSKPSSERFDKLCDLLGEGIIAGIWLYAEDKPGVVQATFDALPKLLQALGIGTSRYLNVLVPQLTHVLIPRPMVDTDRELQLSALRVLLTILDVCSPRVKSWKETMLDGVGRCWVDIMDEERGKSTVVHSGNKDRLFVKKELQQFCVRLAEVCPSVKQEYARFLAFDESLFHDLFPVSTP